MWSTQPTDRPNVVMLHDYPPWSGSGLAIAAHCAGSLQLQPAAPPPPLVAVTVIAASRRRHVQVRRNRRTQPEPCRSADGKRDQRHTHASLAGPPYRHLSAVIPWAE